jgi:integrase
VSPAWIRKRRTGKGVRYMVTYRLGSGDANTVYSAGTFRLEREARTRRDLVGGWLAAGLNPKVELAKLTAPAPVVRTYREWAAAYETSRIDIADSTRENHETHIKRLNKIFGDRDPHEFTVADQIEAVPVLAKGLAASSVSRYWTTHEKILDFAGVEPNPARHRSVQLPKITYVEISPPTAKQLLLFLDKLTPRRYRLPLVVAEQTAMTVGELEALEWGDVDAADNRFRLRRATVKAQIKARARWVQVPDWLMLLILDTCPLEDRTPGRRVFPSFVPDNVRHAMRRACTLAGIPHFSPHELRHRRLSLWHGQGVPSRELAARAGHAKASMTLDVYSHVMPLDEASREALERLLVMTP